MRDLAGLHLWGNNEFKDWLKQFPSWFGPTCLHLSYFFHCHPVKCLLRYRVYANQTERHRVLFANSCRKQEGTFPIHFMTPALPWYQNQAKALIIRGKNYRVASFINTDVKVLTSWPAGSVGWSTVLHTERWLVWFPVGACVGGNWQPIYVSLSSPSLSPPSLPSYSL